MANIDTLKGKLTSIANAIRQKTGRSALLDLDEMPTEILSIDGGGDVPNPDDPLLLVDWDGTLLYSYTAEEIPLISEFPDPPEHELLIFVGWTYAEALAKTWLQTHPGGQLSVGANYTTTDNQDHNYWRSSRLSETANIYMQKRSTQSINTQAFQNFQSLANISIPDTDNGTYYTIGRAAFQYCRSLKAANIPRGVRTIESDAFNSCSTLESVCFPDTLRSMGYNTFQHCENLSKVSLPDGLTILRSYTFYACYALEAVDLPNNLTEIEDNVFAHCCSLKNIKLPDSLTRILGYAFFYCVNITQIDIPENVTSIGNYAFDGCNSLCDIVIRGKPTLAATNGMGSGIPSSQRIYVHRSDLAWFETATNWSAIYGEGKIVAAADYIDYLQSIGIDTADFEGE